MHDLRLARCAREALGDGGQHRGRRTRRLRLGVGEGLGHVVMQRGLRLGRVIGHDRRRLAVLHRLADPGANAVLGRRCGLRLVVPIGLGLEQFGRGIIGIVIGFHRTTDARQEGRACRRGRFDLGCPVMRGVGLLLFPSRQLCGAFGCFGAALTRTLCGRASPRDRGRSPPAQNVHRADIDRDRAQPHEARDRLQLGLGEAENEGRHRQHRRGEDQRQKLQPNHAGNRNDPQHRARDHVAEMPTEAEGLTPLIARHQKRCVNGGDGHGDREEDHPRYEALLAAMGDHAQTPGHQRRGQQPRAVAYDHEQGRGDPGADPAQPVLHRLIRGRHPAWIFGVIGEQHHRGEQAEDDQQPPYQFLATPLQNGLRVLIEKRIALSNLIRCHNLPSSTV